MSSLKRLQLTHRLKTAVPVLQGGNALSWKFNSGLIHLYAACMYLCPLGLWKQARAGRSLAVGLLHEGE